jgi:2-iminobutanoate/2-iminopropanoate deaminase
MKEMKEVVSTANAPAAIGPYCQAVKVKTSEMLFCSGQLPLDPVSGQLATGSYAEQTKRVMDNLRAIIEASGFTMADVVKTTIYLTNLSAFSEVNSVYQSYFSENFPARTTVQVDALPRGAALEIDAMIAK